MAARTLDPQNSAERLIGLSIAGTWLLWAVGGLYILGPVLGWVLGSMALIRWYLRVPAPGYAGARPVITFAMAAWLIGMGAMLVVLLVGHANFDHGIGQTIKSSIGWAKGWALMALFPLAGALLAVRPEFVARAIARLGVQSMILLPLFALAPFIGLPGTLWVSPLKIVGGSGPEFFAATLYTIDPSSGLPRWQFFAPWAPAAGLVATFNIALLSVERSTRWRVAGICTWTIIALMSQSRLALVIILLLPAFFIGFRIIRDPRLLLLGAVVVLLAGIFGPQLVDALESMIAEFRGARAGSSRVRETLARIAVERWMSEAPWFGHGIVESGPHLVEYMPIGSHHTWYGLLFVKGLLGFSCLAVPMAISLVVLMKRSLALRENVIGLAVLVLLVATSFGENLEVVAYLVWPALIVFGRSLGLSHGSARGSLVSGRGEPE